MPVRLLRPYGGFASGAIVTFEASTEVTLIAQQIAEVTSVGAVNPTPNLPVTGAITAGLYGPAVLTNIPIGDNVLTGFETNGVAQTAFNTNITEIFVPHWNTWTGASYLNGTGVGTNSAIVCLFNTNGYLIATSAVAGTLNAAGASVFEKVPFTVPVTLSPGRYFLGLIVDGTTVTPRHVLASFGAEPRASSIATITSFAAALATLTAAPITVPTSFTTAKAPIMQLYS